MAQKKVKKKSVKKTIKSTEMKVVSEGAVTTIAIKSSPSLRALEKRTRKGWEVMCLVSHRGAKIVIDRSRRKFRLHPFSEIRLKTGKAELRPGQRRTEDQIIVKYTVIQTETL